MQKIAQDEIDKSRVKCVLREFPFGTYTYSNHTFDSTSILASGALKEVMIIPKNDDLDGFERNGERMGDQCCITGISLLTRYGLQENTTLHDGKAVCLDKMSLSWRLVEVTAPWSEAPWNDPDEHPSITELFPFYPFGYTPRIDDHLHAIVTELKIRTLCEGSITKRTNDNYAQVDTKKQFVRFSKPIVVNYNPDDAADDHQTIEKRFYLCYRSNCPTNMSNDNLAPNVTSCLKTFYYES